MKLKTKKQDKNTMIDFGKNDCYWVLPSKTEAIFIKHSIKHITQKPLLKN